MENKYLLLSLDLDQEVFSEWDSPEEGKIVRQLVEEIRAKKYYMPELELVMSMKMMRLLVMRCFHVFILRESMKMNC